MFKSDLINYKGCPLKILGGQPSYHSDKMQIIKSSLFEKFPELVFGLSTKIGLNRRTPFYFNQSYTVGDDPKIVKENREAFYDALGLSANQIAIQKQVHSDIVTIVESPGQQNESDAMITTVKGIGLAISTADCVPIFIYDEKQKVIAAVHSGWRGTQKRILEKTISILKQEFNSSPKNLNIYIGPSISQKNYEVGKEVASLFESKFVKEFSGKLFLDVLAVNLELILGAGVDSKNVEVSPLCSYNEKELLHSYRRDGKDSGRSHGILLMRDAQ